MGTAELCNSLSSWLESYCFCLLALFVGSSNGATSRLNWRATFAVQLPKSNGTLSLASRAPFSWHLKQTIELIQMKIHCRFHCASIASCNLSIWQVCWNLQDVCRPHRLAPVSLAPPLASTCKAAKGATNSSVLSGCLISLAPSNSLSVAPTPRLNIINRLGFTRAACLHLRPTRLCRLLLCV